MPEHLGRYELYEEIGAGGFAIVYRGHDTALDRPVALKELRPMLLQDKNWVQRFRREARTIARLDHPNIVPIYDVHEANDRLFIVMRLVEGGSLEALIATQGPLPWPTVLQTITPISDGLSYAHDSGVLHRDLKPANILIDAERGPMLSDFGLAKIMGQHSLSLTDSGSIVGTPHYISPEVWEGKSTSEKSDIYALACILYEMVTGEKLFKGDTPPAVMMAHFKPLSLPAVWSGDVPAQIETVFQAALAQNPAERYATVAEMLAALQAIDGGQLPTPPSTRPAVPPAMSTAPPAETGEQPAPPPAVSAPVTPLLTDVSPAGTQSTPQPELHRRRWGPGCIGNTGCIVIAVAVALVLGLSSFCAAIGGSLGSNLGAPLEGITELLSNSIQVGETITQTITVPAPRDNGKSSLEIEVAADTFILKSGAGNALLKGEVVYNVDMLAPKIVANGPTMRVSHQGTTSDLFPLLVYDFVNQDIRNSWDLSLGNSEMVLSLTTGTAGALVDLSDYAISDMSVSQGIAAELDLTFSAPNQIEMEAFSFSSGPTRRAVMNGLANSRAHRMNFTLGSGDYDLNFGSQIRNDIGVVMQGDATNLTMDFPQNVSVTLNLGDRTGLVDPGKTWQVQGNTYKLTGGDYQITIDATDLNIETTLTLRATQ